MESYLKERITDLSKHIGNPKYFLVLVRKLSGEITEHVKVTTDKFGDVFLNLFLVNTILEHNDKLSRQRFDAVYKLYIYLINKIIKALIQIQKLDEDYWLEFDEILTDIDFQLHENLYLEKLCINNGLDFNWLKCENIPDHFELIVKDIRSQGFLR